MFWGQGGGWHQSSGAVILSTIVVQLLDTLLMACTGPVPAFLFTSVCSTRVLANQWLLQLLRNVVFPFLPQYTTVRRGAILQFGGFETGLCRVWVCGVCAACVCVCVVCVWCMLCAQIGEMNGSHYSSWPTSARQGGYIPGLY